MGAFFGCASSSFVPDTSARIAPPPAREGTSADDVFLRKPWENWRGSSGIGRYHRESSMVFTDEVESFRVGDIAVYAADGSDVRFDYVSVDLGESSQSRETISVFVYRADADLEREWSSLVGRIMRDRPGASEAAPFPLPNNYPASTKELAWTVPGQAGDSAKTFFQVILFHQSKWAVRFEITCPSQDVAIARRTTLSFLRSTRVGN